MSALERRAAVATLLAAMPRGTLVVTGLGSPGYDAFAAGDRDETFYCWGAMGGAAMIGLGLALAQKDRRVLVLTGDGEMLMGMGSLATIAALRPANLSIVVLDNARYGETGAQRSHTALGTDLVRVAAGCGWRVSERVDSLDGVKAVGGRLASEALFAVVAIDEAPVPRALPARDGVWLQHRFRAAIGITEN